MGADALHEIGILPEAGDAAVLRATRTAIRQGAGVLHFSGALEKAADDHEAFVAWIGTLVEARPFLCVSGGGTIGCYGLALILACDLAVLSPGSRCEADLRSAPGLVALARRRLGHAGARRLLFGGADPVRTLAESGEVALDEAPAAAARTRVTILGGAAAAAGLRGTLRAAEELPFAEACEFDAWSRTLHKGGSA